MENATKRIRKARRQGLTAIGRGLGTSPRTPLGTANRLADIEDQPRPNRARKTRVTQRKARRGAKSTSRAPGRK